MRRPILTRALFITACILSCAGCEVSGRDLSQGAAGSGSDERPRLAPIVVAQVLHDFPSLPTKEWCKFEAFFSVGPDDIGPGDIASVYVDGPRGFHFAIANTPFSITSANGYVLNRELGVFWYQAILPGFLVDGEYTISVEHSDGHIDELSRTLRSSNELLSFYRAHSSELRYTPTGTSPADDTELQWTTLAAIGGPDAYYNAWISPGFSEAIDANTARGDTIFADAVRDPSAGKNRAASRMGTEQQPLAAGVQTWQPEILDANVLGEINTIIFPPGQHFTAE